VVDDATNTARVGVEFAAEANFCDFMACNHVGGACDRRSGLTRSCWCDPWRGRRNSNQPFEGVRSSGSFVVPEPSNLIGIYPLIKGNGVCPTGG
jgi:hypothetical protein